MTLLPVSDEQRYIFEVNEAYDSIPMGVSFSMRFLKRFSAEELGRAVGKCMETADIFASRCLARDGRPMIEFLPYRKPDIPVYDFSCEDEYEAFCKQSRAARLNNRDQLYYIFIFSISGAGYHLHFMFNHLIFDGISGFALAEKIEQILLDPERDVQWHPFSRYLEKIEHYTGSNEYLLDQAFWEDRFLDISQSEYLFDELIHTGVSPMKSVDHGTSRELKGLLLQFCEKNNMPPHVLIVSVLARIINEKTECERFYFEIPVQNRVGKNEKNSLGMYEVTFPYIFNFAQYASVADVIESVHRQSVDYYRHRYFDWDSKINSEAFVRQHGRYIPQFSFSYFCGDQEPPASIAVLRQHHADADAMPMSLYISDYLDWQAMTFTYTYWTDFFTEEDVAEIHQAIEDRIMEIVVKTDFTSLEADHV